MIPTWTPQPNSWHLNAIQRWEREHPDDTEFSMETRCNYLKAAIRAKYRYSPRLFRIGTAAGPLLRAIAWFLHIFTFALLMLVRALTRHRIRIVALPLFVGVCSYLITSQVLFAIVAAMYVAVSLCVFWFVFNLLNQRIEEVRAATPEGDDWKNQLTQSELAIFETLMLVLYSIFDAYNQVCPYVNRQQVAQPKDSTLTTS